MIRVRLFPEAHLHFGVQFLLLVPVQDDKDLVGRGGEGKSVALADQGFTNPGRGFDGSPAAPQIQIIRKKCVKLESCDPSLGQQGAMLFDDCKKVRDKVMLWYDRGLSEQGAALCSADIEGVAERSQVRELDVIFRAGKGVGQPGSVHIEGNVIFPADAADLPEFPQGVEGSALGRLGEIDHAGFHHVVAVQVAAEGFHKLPDPAGADLSVLLGQGQDLVAPVFDRPGLMGADMSALRSDHPLPGTQDGIDDRGVDLGSACEKEYIRFRRMARCPDPGPGRFGKFIQPVACGLCHVGLQQPLQDRRMSAFHIVRSK